MDAGTVFATVSLTMWANGIVLWLVYRDLPMELRLSAVYWLIGTLLIALGCATFAFGGFLPRTVMLTSANGFFVFGLTAYLRSLQEFDDERTRLIEVVPAIVATACVLFFSSVYPSFGIRVVVVSIVWIWLMAACVRVLVAGLRDDRSFSRRMLVALFVCVLVYTIVRLLLYLGQNPSADFAVETGSSWINLASPLIMTVLPIVGTTAFALMCSDQLRRQLEKTASTDYLTGLPNRRALVDHGSEMFGRARASRSMLAVAVLDVDFFKAINDTYGHTAGDLALSHLSRRLRAATRKNDIVARSGGEEFVVLMEGLSREEGAAAVERLLLAVKDTAFNLAGTKISITLSGGVAAYRADDTSFDDILRRADDSLYLAKARGRNRVEILRTGASQEECTIH